jgi:hypothetical protein
MAFCIYGPGFGLVLKTLGAAHGPLDSTAFLWGQAGCLMRQQGTWNGGTPRGTSTFVRPTEDYCPEVDDAKAQGNQHMRLDQLEKALECYTRAGKIEAHRAPFTLCSLSEHARSMCVQWSLPQTIR